MTIEQKTQVADALMRYTSGFETQALAAESLQGVNQATIAKVLSRQWAGMNDHLWSTIARQVGFYCGEWKPAETSTFLLLRILFGDAQHYAMGYGVSIYPGMGKTYTALQYLRENENVFYMPCSSEYNRRTFMTALIKVTGGKTKGKMPEMIKTLNEELMMRDEVLMIFDDAQNLKERVLQLLITVANSLAGSIGIILMGDEALRERILDGVNHGKEGYDVIYNTFGRRFITLGNAGPRDTELICKANGLENASLVDLVAAECKGNLHNITRLVHRYKSLKIAA